MTDTNKTQQESPTSNNNNGVTICENANKTQKPRKSCLACGADGVKNRCGGCRRVYFCDRECQKLVWMSHRPECQRLIASADASADDAAATNDNKSNAEESMHSSNANANANTSNTSNLHQSVSIPNEMTNANANKPTNMTPHENATAMASPTKPTPAASPKKKAVVLAPEPQILTLEIPEENDAQDAPESECAKKKKKHKKKKKARSNSMHAPASAPMARSGASLKSRSQSLSVKKHVVWGEVHVREFTRFPGGGGAVPYDGSWALGLGSPVADVQLGSVLEVEELRLQELDARTKELTKSQRARVREGETRQFDYKSGLRNPLFGRLSERERKKLFSETEVTLLASPSQSPSRRKRTMSCEGEEPEPLSLALDVDGADFACVSSEQLDEFVKIRDSRDDACGCSCGDLLKRVAKMNVKKLHAFLMEREAHVSGHSKPELLAAARAIASREKNCGNAKFCECARNGVPCHSNVCEGCAGDCFNPHDQYSYKKDQVQQYRKMQIAKWKEEHVSHEHGQQLISVV